MSDLSHPEYHLPPTNEPLRISVRRLRWFRAAFQKFTQDLGAEIGCVFHLDEPKLAEIFVRWLRAIERQKPADKSARKDYFEFAAGLMLREFTADLPLKALSAPRNVAADSAAAFWPEGYVCTLFCLTVHAAAAEQEFHDHPDVAPAFDDLRQWWSFRENIRQDNGFSVGFLQLLLGHQPNWAMPDVFRARLQHEISEATPRPV
ncbi:MAG: hypothetical protein A3D16_13805 [Rhodobacterales bacterium RIFCSPHIGHO2_02_FULL_62_130]|nr:MAG: hypothetical protein A3D16_13805 [Rhodobacterales bacterium RIFCSPHIGHO2_02_FULL_62_130]OHC60036.1 MAG: hypothetical protein A3E48_15975 [Rhodobacterales bacterium RIFCSPHIGHO2_12_FULL_62_75]HCY98713.1 hypothetical protein [Rhodobacter sp.]